MAQLRSPQPADQPHAALAPGLITRRALIIGLVLVALLAWATPYNDYLIGATLMAGNYLPIAAFFVLFSLTVGGNFTLRSIRPQWALRPSELIVIWAMIATAASIPGSGLMRFVIPHSVAPLHYASPENHWEQDVISHFPEGMIIRDQDAVESFFKGSRDGHVPWKLWAQPLLIYGVFIIALYASFFCLASLLRRQWVDRERFAFPLATLPVEMVREPEGDRKLGPLWYNAWLWIPVVALTAIHTNNGLQRFYPALPVINLYNHPINFFVGRPLNILNGLRYPIYPLVIGVSFLLKSETLLSLWFFFVVFQIERVLANAWGLNPAQNLIGYGTPAFAVHQAAGVALGLMLWIGRNSRSYFADLLARRGHAEDANEAIPPLMALYGWLGCLVVMFAWVWYFGGSPVTALFTVVFGTVGFAVLAWMVAQGGLLFLQTPWSGAELAVNLLGFKTFTPRNILVSNQVEAIFMLDMRELALPQLFNSLKMTDYVSVQRRSLFIAIAAAVVLSMLISGEESIRLPYRYGAEMMYDKWAYVNSPQRPLQFLSSQLLNPLQGNPFAWLNMGAGLAGFWGLMMMYTRFVGFPLHPAGFIFASGYPLQCFWFSYLLAWILKSVVMRYGGQKFYQKMRPFAFGLILGDALNGAVWIIIALITRKPYSVLPG